MARFLNKTKPVSQEYSTMSTKKFCPDGPGLSGLSSRVEELKTMFENRLNTLEKKMDLLITTCSSILSNCDDHPLTGLKQSHGHVCCAALLLPKIMVIDDFIKNTLINGDNKNNANNNTGPLVLVPSGKPSVRDTSGGGQVISLNSEQDLPDGSWLGDRNDPKGRVRVNIPPSILIHINERCQTPEKMALTLLDYLFPREVLAISNISGKGKHSKCQLDPLKIFAIRCHLVHKFSITEHDWYRIKQNIDAKCRAVWRKKINGLPLETNKLHFLRSELGQSTDVDSDDCNPSQIFSNSSLKSVIGDDQQFTLLQDGQTVKVFMDDEFKELLQTSWADDPASVESLSVDDSGVFAHYLVEQKLLVSAAANAEKSLDVDSDPLLYSSSNSHSGSDFGSDKPDK
ncbi:hypothetical protein GE061_005694 [Apolygus lucorum]|uniref:Protein BANP n=1 Tax=Apolygus lucorum TaxID=248454 RepID=A0A6A4IT23_APOLU|nr:hypothetical protein GE061_005694 [Apolygus lucorum]